MSRDDNVQSILEDVQGYRRGRIYTTFAELEIGDVLDGTARSIADIARAIDVDPAALKRFLDACEAFGLVTIRTDELVSLSDLGWRLYAPSSPVARTNTLRLEGAFFERWSRLSDAIRVGTRPPENRQQEDDPGWVPMFTRALYERSRRTSVAVAATLEPLISEYNRENTNILDLGGGHGGYSIALADRCPSVHATVFDLPTVIETTQQIIRVESKTERVRAVAGDFHVDAIGTGWDYILLFGVLHGETAQGAALLLTAISNALAPDGRLLIRTRGRSDQASSRGERELFDLHMLLSTDGGRVSRATDTDQLLLEHSFEKEQELDIREPGSGTILVYKLSG